MLRVLITFLILATDFAVHANEFFHQSKRGWFWFEDKKEEKKEELTPEQARVLVENFKAELDDARNIMFVNPTVENTLKYMKLEEAMWNRGMKLYHAYEMAKFVDPKLVRSDTEPTNVHGIRISRDNQKQDLQNFIHSLPQEYDMVLFRSETCKYCAEFEPVLMDFSRKYGFKVEAISTDGTKSNYFKTEHIPHLVKSLKIESTPTVFMVHKTKPIKFELMRGFLSMTELETRFLVVKMYMQNSIKGNNA